MTEGATILVVEDDPLIAEFLERTLAAEGYRVPMALASGEAAVRWMPKIRPDLVLMDILLAGEMDGIEAARMIGERSDVPLIYLSSHHDEAFLARARATNPTAFLVKPINARELTLTIEFALRKESLERGLRERERHLAEAQRVGRMGSWEWRMESGRLEWSAEVYRIFGVGPGSVEVTREAFLAMVHVEDRDRVRRAAEDALYRRGPYEVDYRVPTADGEKVVHEQAELELAPGGEVLRMVGTIQDVTERTRAEERLGLFATIFEHAAEGVVVTDGENRIEMVNEAYCVITGYAREELIGHTPRDLRSGYHDDDFYQTMWRSLKRDGKWCGEIWDRRKDGEVFPKWLSIFVLKDGRGAVRHHVGIFTDITEMKEKEQRLQRLAYYDGLTGLANRAQFIERLKQEMAVAKRRDEPLALLFIDLDRFKAVNDGFGHDVGDEVLRQAAERMRDCVRESDILARLGGDEFTLLLTAVKDGQGAAQVAEKVVAALTREFRVGERRASIGASVGISLYPRDGEEFEALLLSADRAMYHAKEEGGGGVTFSSAALNQQVKRRLFLDHALRRALEEGQLELHYQPQVELASGRITGMEALLRWNHPQEGVISPVEFIPRAESTLLILPIGEWVLRQACEQNRAWQAAGLPAVPVAVNFSAAQFTQPGMARMVNDTLISSDLAPCFLDVEVTESVSMKLPERTISTLSQLRECGAGCSIDDFGTGYSSLSYLKRFPVDKLKIDRAFVRDLAHDRNDRGIATAVVQLARSMELKVVAEGVEDAMQRDLLTELGCDFAQGFYFARPLDAAAMGRFLAAESEALPERGVR